jgi:hypothetical protein
MAVGDIVNINTGSAGSYQPSSGIEIILLTPLGNTQYYGFTDGTTPTKVYMEVGNGGRPMYKLGITNSQYFYTESLVAHAGFSGIQIK